LAMGGRMATKRSKRRGNGEGTLFQRRDGRWQADLTVGYDENGKQLRKSLYGRTQEEARTKLDAFKQQRGTLRLDRETVSGFLERWAAVKDRHVKPTTMAQYRYCIDKHIVPRLGRVKLVELTPVQVHRFVGQVADEAGASTANKCRIVLHNAYKQGMRWQVVSVNPAAVVDPLPQKKREMRLWEPDEAARFLDLTQGHRLYALFYLAMSTGLRRGELLGLRWQDIRGATLSVVQTRVKVNGEMVVQSPKSVKGTRRIGLSTDLLTVLERHRRGQDIERASCGPSWHHSDLVFTSEIGTPVDPDNLKRTTYRLMDRAGVPRVRLHDLRHFHSSICIRHGMDPRMLADRLGHSRASFTLDRYTHLFEEQRQQSAISLMDFIPIKASTDLGN